MGTPFKKYHFGLSLNFLGQTPPEQNCEKYDFSVRAQRMRKFWSWTIEHNVQLSITYNWPHGQLVLCHHGKMKIIIYINLKLWHHYQQSQLAHLVEWRVALVEQYFWYPGFDSRPRQKIFSWFHRTNCLRCQPCLRPIVAYAQLSKTRSCKPNCFEI